MPVHPTSIYDGFSRVHTDTWGTTDSGQSWIEGTNSLHDMNGSRAIIEVPANRAKETTYIDLSTEGIGDQGDSEVLVKIRYTSSTAYPITEFGPALRRTSASTFYAVSIEGNYGEVAIKAYVNGAKYELARTTKAVSKDSWQWVRFRSEANRCKVKVWSENTTEPSSWLIDTIHYDQAGAPAAGDMGIYYQGTANSYNIECAALYYFTLDEADDDSPFPISDTFERTINKGWGWTNSGNLWYGNVADAPEIVGDSINRGSVSDPGDGYGTYEHSYIGERWAWVGPSRGGSVEAFCRYSLNSTAGQTYLRLGLRGTSSISGGSTAGAGYALEIVSGDNVVRIRKKSSTGGAWSTVATSATFTAVTTGIFRMRFQIDSGGVLRGRIWADGVSENTGSWNVTYTDASPITSGRAFWSLEQPVTTKRTLQMYEYSYGTPTPTSGTNHLSTGPVTVGVPITDTTVTLYASYSNDSNQNSTITAKIKTASGSYTNISSGNITTSRANTRFQIALTGLLKKTTYTVSVTYADADTVLGTNPRTLTFTTLGNGITTGTTNLLSIGSNTADIEALYTDDDDSDSTATAAYRSISTATQKVLDNFVAANGTALTSHSGEVGGAWIKHAGGASDLSISTGRVHGSFLSPTNNMAIYYANTVAGETYVDVETNIYVSSIEGNPGVMACLTAVGSSYYLARFNVTLSRWEIVRVQSGVETVLATSADALELASIYQLKFSVRTDYKGLFVDGIERCFSTDATLTNIATGYTGMRYDLPANSSSLTGFQFDSFITTTRTSVGSWVTSGAMTANRPLKKFTHTITGLSSDTVYEFRATFTDADGITGSNPTATSGMTVGQTVRMDDIAFATSATGATVDVFYSYDNNNNSSIVAQYRSIMDQIWTSVNASSIEVDRVAKRFSFQVGGLRPGVTYEVQVVISDPNGVFEGSDSLRSETFSTVGSTVGQSLQTKHYVWKVYDEKDSYITTWEDAGVPEYGWDENGGVSDLTVTLPRKINSIHDDKSGIAFHNRVDVWCLDPSSDGFGSNLCSDPEFSLGGWALGANAVIDVNAGPDDTHALKIDATPTGTSYESYSPPIMLDAKVPLVVKAIAKAQGGNKLQMFVEAYDSKELNIDQSDDTAETVGAGWQQLRLEYTPPTTAEYIRVVFRNTGVGDYWADKVEVRGKEVLIYRGRIEAYTPRITATSEDIEIEILGLVSLLSDDYIEFLQFVTSQPLKDVQAGRENLGPMDPSDILRIVLAEARKSNPQFAIQEGEGTIKQTGTLVQTTFRDQQIRACLDKIRGLCPPGWHYFVEANGVIHLRGPQHAPTHKLRLGVEISNFSVERSIKNLKNYIHVKGRQDEDKSEADGHGSIHYIAMDPESIKLRGKRMLFIRDANIVDPETAEIVGDGRLEEFNKEEQRAQCNVPDEKSIVYTSGALKGYNIEAIQPGDNVQIYDPIAGPNQTYWDQLIWDVDTYDISVNVNTLPTAVPVKTVQFHGTYSLVELSERQPSQVGDFGRLHRWLQDNDSDRDADS